MRKILSRLLLDATGHNPMYASSPNDWLNFAETQNEEVIYSVQFTEFGKVRFGNIPYPLAMKMKTASRKFPIQQPATYPFKPRANYPTTTVL